MARPVRVALASLALLLALSGCKLMADGERPVDLDYAAPLDVAVAAAEEAGYNVVGFEFSNGSMYGGYSLVDFDTIDAALEQFEADYGTQPVVVKVVVDPAPLIQAGPIITGRTSDFTAPDAVMPGMSDEDVATYLMTEAGSDTDALDGVLARDAGCTYLVDQDGTRWLPIFGEGATWWDDELYDGPAVYALGVRVTLPGTTADADLGTIPASCDLALKRWQVAQPAD